MGGGLRDHAGGIVGLHRQLAEHGEALRYDLYMAGRSIDLLGTPELSWLDLRAIMRHSPRGSAYYRAVHGEVAEWDMTVQLLAVVADRLGAGNWQRGGGKGGKPKPIPRPKAHRRIGTTVLSLEAMDRLLGYTPRTL